MYDVAAAFEAARQPTYRVEAYYDSMTQTWTATVRGFLLGEAEVTGWFDSPVELHDAVLSLIEDATEADPSMFHIVWTDHLN